MSTEDVNKLADEIEVAWSEFTTFSYHLLNDLKLWPGNPRDNFVQPETTDE